MWTDGRTDRQTDGRTDRHRRTDKHGRTRQTDRRTDRQTDGQRDMTSVIVSFNNSPKSLKNQPVFIQLEHTVVIRTFNDNINVVFCV